MSAADPETSEPRRRGRLAPKLLAAAIALVLAFLVVEVLARMRYGTPLAERLPIAMIQADPLTGWRMIPGEDHYTYQHRVSVNQLGLRGPELEAKAEGERRVFALGDSLIYGQGVADDQTVPAHLAQLLCADGERWTVVNGGHRAYATHQELGLLEDLGPRVDPDVVVVFWFWNDMWERNVAETHERLRDRPPVAFDTGEPMEGSVLWRWRAVQLVRRSALVMAAHDLWRARDAAPPVMDQVDGALSRLDGYLARFQKMAAREGFELLFAVIPDANALADTPEAPHFTASISARAEEVARARGLRVCALEPALEGLVKEQGALPVLPYDGHYTGPANRAMAAAVAACLRDR